MLLILIINLLFLNISILNLSRINLFLFNQILFLIYINDLPDCVEKPSYTCLFADDANIGHILQSSDDISLQLTLANIDKWMSTWQPPNVKLCVLVNVSNKSNYYLNDNL